VVGCYEASGQGIGTSSRHIDKYYRGRMTFLWIIRHVQDILRGKYDQRSPSSAQKTFSTSLASYQQQYTPLRSTTIKKETVSHLPTYEAVIKEIKGGIDKGTTQQILHMALLQKVGVSLYKSWCQGLTISQDKEKLVLEANTRFVRDQLNNRLSLTEGVTVILATPSANFNKQNHATPHDTPTRTSSFHQDPQGQDDVPLFQERIGTDYEGGGAMMKQTGFELPLVRGDLP